MFIVFNFRYKIKYDYNIDLDLIYVSDDYGGFVKISLRFLIYVYLFLRKDLIFDS